MHLILGVNSLWAPHSFAYPVSREALTSFVLDYFSKDVL